MPTQCCLLGVCCPPEQRQKQLAQMLFKIDSGATEMECEALSVSLLGSYDLAPKGLSEFIVAGYGKAFSESP